VCQLGDSLRFRDDPPRSRNETLAAFMRCIKVCEERGSGIDSDENYSMVSRVISEAIAAELVKPYDPDSGSTRHASDVPFLA
jgi:predicted HTH transcriptional regulator